MTPRTYTEEFRQDAVDLVRGGRRIQDVANQLGIPRGTVRGWVVKAGVAIPQEPQAEEISVEGYIDAATHQAALRRIAELERQNETLIAASALFARKLNV